MKTITKTLIGLFAILALLLAAFLLTDFRLMSSRDSANSSVASSHGGEGSPQSIEVDMTGLYVDGPGGISNALQSRLEQALQGQQHVGEVTILNAPADQMDIAQVIVELTPRQYLWTPLYAQSTYDMVVSYASNGDVSFRNQETTVFQFKSGGPALQFQGKFTLADTSFGLISSPGYRHYLAEKMAGMILDSFQQEYNR